MSPAGERRSSRLAEGSEQYFREDGEAFFAKPLQTQPFERNLLPIFLLRRFGEALDAFGFSQIAKGGSIHSLSPIVEHVFENTDEDRGFDFHPALFPNFPDERVFRRLARLDESADRDEKSPLTESEATEKRNSPFAWNTHEARRRTSLISFRRAVSPPSFRPRGRERHSPPRHAPRRGRVGINLPGSISCRGCRGGRDGKPVRGNLSLFRGK